MKDILKKLIDIDKNARAQVKNANEASVSAIEEFERKKQRLKEKNEAEFAEMLELEKQKQRAQLQQVEKDIEQTHMHIIDEFDSLYNENGEQWVTSIVENVTQM